MAIKRMSVRNSAIVLTAANIVSQLFGFLYRILLGRLIGAEGMGLFQLIFPFYNLFLSLAATGLCVAVSRLSAEYLALQQYGAIKKLVSRALLTFFLLFILFSGLSLLFAEEIAVHFLGDERTLLAVYALIPVIFFTGIENLHKNFFYGTATVLPPAISDILEMTVRMSAVLLLLRLFLPVPDPKMLLLIVLGMLTCEIVSSLFLRTLYVRKTRGYAGRGAPDPNMKQKMRNIAVPISLSSFLNNILGSLMIVLIPRRLEAAGYTHAAALTMFGELFGMTLPLLTLPTAFIHGLSLMILPKVTENLALRDYKALDRQISKTVLVTS
ncbi:oligosaccharide flippase family protein, partial [Oscillospiraceae bacterium OttesenSCG-928-G22]|nr:oligosaccharide flippase family protein [Oscillospiraceae bacterium OttesenSCG-928-G22]